MNIHLIRFKATFKWDLALFLSNEEKSPSIANHCKTLQQQPIFDQKMSDTRRRMRSYTVAVSSGGGVRSLEDLCVSGTSFVLSHLGKLQLGISFFRQLSPNFLLDFSLDVSMVFQTICVRLLESLKSHFEFLEIIVVIRLPVP